MSLKFIVNEKRICYLSFKTKRAIKGNCSTVYEASLSEMKSIVKKRLNKHYSISKMYNLVGPGIDSICSQPVIFWWSDSLSSRLIYRYNKSFDIQNKHNMRKYMDWLEGFYFNCCLKNKIIVAFCLYENRKIEFVSNI